MGWRAREWARGKRCESPRAKNVLLCIAEFHNDRAGYAWPSLATIANETGYSVSTVKRAIADLKNESLLVSSRQKFVFNQGHASNRYYLIGYSKKLPEKGRVFQDGSAFGLDGKWEQDFNEWDPT